MKTDIEKRTIRDEIAKEAGFSDWHELSESITPNGITAYCNDAMETYANQKVEQYRRDHQQWISVEDRLPEESGCVLIWTSHSIRTDYAFLINGKWKFYHDYKSFWLCDQPQIKVTHWMPLPSPPKP